MSNIQSPRGLQVPTFQAAGQKGDGGGNGGGGMYFGQGPYEEPDSFTSSSPDHDADLGDVPYSIPFFNSIREALSSWRTALATLLYKNVSKS
jgi:hypothetical protein